MVKLEKVVGGVCNYVDYVLGQRYQDDDLKRLIYGTGAAVYIKKHLSQVISAMAAMGIYDSETDSVDVDILKDEFLARVGKGDFTFEKKPLGKLTFTAEDVEELYNCIVS